MAITVTPNGGPEPCCRCRTLTHYWHEPQDVACCPDCAIKLTPNTVPTKRQWLESQGVKLPADWRTERDRRAAQLNLFSDVV